MTYTTSSPEQLELFTEADLESVQIESMDLEGLESMLEESLESISAEDVAENVEYYMVEERGGYASSRYLTRRLTKVFTYLVKKAVKKIATNPRTRSKLHAACRKGPTSVTKLIVPIVAKPLPSYFRFLAPIYCRPIIARLFPSIAKEAGLKPEEVEAAPEWIGAAIGIAGTVASLFI